MNALAGKEKMLQAILDKSVDNKKIYGISFAVKHNTFSWLGAAGNFTVGQQYFIASTTKLFTTAIILKLKSLGKINLDAKISNYLDEAVCQGLHVIKETDHSVNITIRQLLSHTSGLPDYFQNKGPNGKSLEDELFQKNDQYWSFEEAIARSKQLKPLFEPGKKGKAHYSDTNFQLLGKIIENISGKSYAEICDEWIIHPLQLSQTYVYQDPADHKPNVLYYKTEALNIPKAMVSFGPDGGMVSTSSDMLTFIEAFFKGKLFPSNYLEELQQWNRIFFPMQSGTGIHKFQLPWIFNPTGSIPWFIGHSGLSGALAFFSPKENLYITGTVNQVAHPDLSFRTMIKLAQVAIKK
jgi:CubicO group peptidase (beta-lactamase class C family)